VQHHLGEVYLKFELELSQLQKEVLAETVLSEEDLAGLLRSAIEADNEDILVAPQTQAQIDSLNGYVDSVRGSVIAPLNQAKAEVQRLLDNANDLCDRAVDMINKAQRSTSQRIQLLTGAKGKR
jgi:TolA-binding protein